MPRKQTYEVQHGVFLGHGPGEEFEATPEEASFGIEIGAIKKVERKTEKKNERRS